MKDKTIVHAISNNHCDLEWVYPFEQTRLLLVDFIDNLLDLLENDPDFNSFTLDSQTIAIDDYLELRPENLDRIKKQVKSGRLIVGPWYSLPEEYICNGESLVRNLLIGHKVATSLGKVSKVGYTPFSYGQTSQIPQIYRGFDIDSIIFYRGINSKKSEFILEGPDGSRLLGMRFGCLSRLSYYFYVYRMFRYGMGRYEWWYDWDRGAAPCRLANDSKPNEHYYILDSEKRQWNTHLLKEQLESLIKDESEHFSTRNIACMQGYDASHPDPKESEIVKLSQELMPEHEIKLSNLEEFMNALRKEVKDPEVITGECREPSLVHKWTSLFGDVISTRVCLKQANAKAEISLQRLAEPFSCISSALGGEYFKSALDRCWKFLLQNHPHDTITGAGIDQMQKDSLYRFDQVCILSEGLTRRALQNIQINIDNSDLSEKDSVLTVFNPLPVSRKGIVSCYIDMPDRMGYEDFTIQCPQTQKVLTVQKKEPYKWGTLVRNLQDVSLELPSQRVHCHIEVDEIPALGYRTYHINRDEVKMLPTENICSEVNVMENEYLRLEFNSNGTVDLTNKKNGHTYKGLHYFEDTGETGHPWEHLEPENNETIVSFSPGVSVNIIKEENGSLLSRMRVDYHMQIPKGLTDNFLANDRGPEKNNTSRTAECETVTITSRFTLRKDSKRVDVITTMNNPCKNHRLRVVFPSHLNADVSCAEAAYDVIARDIHIKKTSAYYGRKNPQYPMHRFVDISDGKNGLAILNTGIREFEAMDTVDRPIAITLLRAFTFRQTPILDRWDAYPEMKLSQCLGSHEWTYSICPHIGDWTENIYFEAEDLNLPLETVQAGPHSGTLPKAMSFLEIIGENIQLTAFKKAEDRDTYILRLFNPTTIKIEGQLEIFKNIKNAWLNNMNEERLKEIECKGNIVELDVASKKIITVEIEI